MTVDHPERGRSTAASSISGRWPGLVWAAPMAALMVVGYLGLNALVQRGIDVVVTFDTAAGAKVGDTQVVYKGVKIGRVTKIAVSSDARHVDLTLRLDPQTRDALREGAKFWLIGTQPSLTDLSSLKAVVSGVSIGASPGSGPPRRRFVGLDAPPPIPPGEPGSYYLLHSANLGSERIGSGVYFHGQEIGRVTQVALDGGGRFQLTAFVQAPFDRLVHPTTRFYGVSPFEVSFNSAGVGARLGPGNSVLAGGLEIETSVPVTQDPSPSGASFPFYADANQADAAAPGPEVFYRATFDGDGGDLHPEAMLTLNGFPVGRVLSRRLIIGGEHGGAKTEVRIAMAPEQLGLNDIAEGDHALGPAEWRIRTDQVLKRLIGDGYRLEITRTPPLLGAASLRLARDGGAAGGRLNGDLVPTRSPQDLSALMEKSNILLDHLDQIPLADIGRNVRDLTGRLDGLVRSPALKSSLGHLNTTLANLDQITSEARPEVGPMVRKLEQTADALKATAQSANALVSGEGAATDANLPDTLRRLNATAREIEALADYLGRHPEAVIKGKGKAP